jgi:hypothetical protein
MPDDLSSSVRLQFTIIYDWHINAKPEQIACAPEIDEMTFDDVDEHRAGGIVLLSAIRSVEIVC